jgi:hypothetical protein
MPDLTLNPHLTGDSLWLCDACSQLITIRVELPTQMLRPTFCPWCGSEALRSVKSTVKEQLKGKCFADIDPQLVGLLYSVWRTETDGHASFLSYVDAQIAGGDEE